MDAGRLSLDADISEALGYRVRHPRHANTPITPRLQLSHRSSLSDEALAYLEPGQQMQAGLSDAASPRWAAQAPGTFFQYCNLNFGVLASVIERASGQRFERFASEQVLRPRCRVWRAGSGGLGLAVCRLSIALPALAAGSLVLAHPLVLKSPRSNLLVVREDSAALPAVRAFTGWLREQVAETARAIHAFDDAGYPWRAEPNYTSATST